MFIRKGILYRRDRRQLVSSAARINTKLDDLYSGPYVVTKVVGNNCYRIRSISKRFTKL